jgi:MFS family permease
MSDTTQNRILRITRWLVYLIMGLIAVAAVILSGVAVILPFYWQDAVIEIAKHHPALDSGTLLPYLYVVFAFGIVVLGFVWTILRKLLAIIVSVEHGDPFNTANARRLKAIGWLMIAVQIVGLPLAVAAGKTADLFGKNHVGIDVSLNGILGILLVFILAGIFERGAEMREELEGTV